MTIKLNKMFVVQPALQYDTAVVLQNDENVANKTLKSLVELGENKSVHYWVEIYNKDNYKADWTDEDVADAVIKYFESESK